MTETSKIHRSTIHEKKLQWLAENETELNQKYPGMWVAISDGGFAGVGTTLREAKEQASSFGTTDAAYLRIRPLELQGKYIVPGFRVVR
jgi:hypothetical protein